MALRRWVSVAVLAAVAAVLTGCGGAKSYFFPRVEIDAIVHADGSISITEHRTFAFDGDFSYGYFTVEHKQFSDVVSFEVAEGDDVYEQGAPNQPGHVLLEDSVLEGPGGFKFRATWYFDAHDEERTFTFRYRVLCAVDTYADAAHLLWLFVGRGWTERTEHAVITIHLPEVNETPGERPGFPCFASSLLSGGEVPPIPVVSGRPLRAGETRAWGHGPLEGEVRIPDPSTVVLDVRDVPPDTFVEGSVLFPVDAVPLEYQTPEPGRQRILDEEARLAEEANAVRREALASERRRALARNIGWGFLAGIPVLGLITVVAYRRKERIPGVPKVLSEPPEEALRPAILAMEYSVWRRRLDTANAFRAQLLSLAKERSIEIRPLGTVSESTDFELIPRRPPADQLDAEFYEGLFPDGTPIRTADFKASTKQLNGLGKWWDGVLKSSKAFGHRVRKGFLPLALIPFTVPFWVFPFTFISGLTGWYIPALFVVSVATPMVARRFLPLPYPPERMERMQRWHAFRRYLKDFSSLPDAPTAAIVIWEQYLAFAVALGVADRVEKQVRTIVPPQSLRSPWAGVSAAATPPPALSNMIGSLASRSLMRSTTFNPPSTGSSGGGSSSSFSSGGGFGGGFSGGGGGGGGGTGGGAG